MTDRRTPCSIVLLVALTVGLHGCDKSAGEREATSRRFDDALSDIRASLPGASLDQVIPDEVRQRFRRACARLDLFDARADVSGCEPRAAGGALDGLSPAAPSEDERRLLDRYATDADRSALRGAILSDAGERRAELVDALVSEHDRWTDEFTSRLERVERIVNAAVDGETPPTPVPEPIVAALGAAALARLDARLTIDAALLAALRSGADVEPAEALERFASLARRLVIARDTSHSVPAYRAWLEDEADNATWDAQASLSPVRGGPSQAPGGPPTEAMAQASSAFDDWLQRAGALDALRDILPGDRRLESVGTVVTAQPASSGGVDATRLLDTQAAGLLVDDCSALLSIDEAAFDEICGAAASALADALQVLGDRRAGGSDPGPGPSAEAPAAPRGPSADVAFETLKSQLRARARGAGTRSDTGPLATELADGLVAALTERIATISRAHAQASVAGFVEEVARVEARLDLVHAGIRTAADGALPARLADPLALLSRDSAGAALEETARLRRIVERALTLLSEAPELEIARDELVRRESRLAAVLAAPATRDDLAALVRGLDPTKAKAVAADSGARIPDLAAASVEAWAEKLGGLPVRFETWRGPRGPPAADPGFPRSTRARRAIDAIGRDPLRAVHGFAALRAEHRAFYRAVADAGGPLAARWEFGRADPRAWMASMLAPADLAVAIAKMRVAVPEPLALADGWAELSEATKRMEQALVAEMRARRVASGGHPPGYPPGHPPGVRVALEQYTKPFADREPSSIERQIRLQIAREMYPSADMMPAALRTEVAEQVSDRLEAELRRLDTIVAKLHGRDGEGGLLDRAARAVARVPDSDLEALRAAHEQATRATGLVASRIAAAERDGYVRVDRDRWRRIEGWYGLFGLGPDAAWGTASPDPRPSSPGSGGGARALFASAEVERSFLELESTIAAAEEQLSAAEGLEKREVKPALVGARPGRAVASRHDWADGSYVFDNRRMVRGHEHLTRYPDGAHGWDGFFDKNKRGDVGRGKPPSTPRGSTVPATVVAQAEELRRPFDFERYVQSFQNFRGVGGGVHMGETARPSARARELLGPGALLEYQDGSGMLVLRLASGKSYAYGPVEPRVLKALYAYVTAYPGINLAVTIGATGDMVLEPSADTSPVLLDPRFVDGPVGQDLYLADTIPWGLDEALLPNGARNPARSAFAAALETFEAQREASAAKLAGRLRGVRRLGGMGAGHWSALLDRSAASYQLLLSLATEPTWNGYRGAYVRQETRRQMAAFGESGELDRAVGAVRRQAEVFSDAGFSAAEVRQAMALSKPGAAMQIIRPFGFGPWVGNDETLPGLGSQFLFDDGEVRREFERRILSGASLPFGPDASSTPVPENVRALAQWIASLDLSDDGERMFALAIDYLGPAGESAVRRAFIDEAEGRARRGARARFGEIFGRVPAALKESGNHARRALSLAPVVSGIGRAGGFDGDVLRVSNDAVRVMASARLEIAASQGRVLSLDEVARGLPHQVLSLPSLAVLFDDRAMFDLSDGRLELDAVLRYRYATADVSVQRDGLHFALDGSEERKPIRARQIDALAEVATDALPDLMEVYPPLARVREHAALAAFLRWAACADERARRCVRRPGVAIDLSALGRYDLRDRGATPTPDADSRP